MMNDCFFRLVGYIQVWSQSSLLNSHPRARRQTRIENCSGPAVEL